MHGVIISAFDTCVQRAKLLKDYYESKGHQITYITSDFSHVSKQTQSIQEADIHIHVREYRKNLSLDRIRSHREFAKKAVTEVEKMHPDFIHCLIPPNYLTQQMAQYKKKHPGVKLFFDIIDVWPETMPMERFQSLLPFRIWKNKRDKYLDSADRIFTECELFQSVLPDLNPDKLHTLFWARDEMPMDTEFRLKEDELHFCYLGSINNIIDIQKIVSFLSSCHQKKPTVLHIIGQGESKEQFIREVEAADVRVIDHGSLYEQKEKQEVFDQCHYGLNIMKESVVVGLTMKSLDYMCGQLPIINTIEGDTKKLCEKYDIGYHLYNDQAQTVVDKVCAVSVEENIQQRMNIKNVYLTTFTKSSFEQTLDSVGLFDA